MEKIKELCIDANIYLPTDITSSLNECLKNEDGELAKDILGDIIKNYTLAQNRKIPVWKERTFRFQNRLTKRLNLIYAFLLRN